MKPLLFILLPIILTSCTRTKVQKVFIPIQEPEKKVYYCYVTLKTSVPKLDVQVDSREVPTLYGGWTIENEYTYYTEWQQVDFASDVQEITNLSEDGKYMLMDQFESHIQLNLRRYESEYELEVRMSWSSDKEKLLDKQSKIEQRECLVFDSYKEASISRSNYLK